MIMGEVDMSVGAVYGFSGTLVGALMILSLLVCVFFGSGFRLACYDIQDQFHDGNDRHDDHDPRRKLAVDRYASRVFLPGQLQAFHQFPYRRHPLEHIVHVCACGSPGMVNC